MIIWKGMSYVCALAAVLDSDRVKYIAEGDGWFWVRTRHGDVVEVSHRDGVVTDVDIL